MLGSLSTFLFGYDFFISYAYRDGRDYAAAVDKKLSNLDFTCFFDASELPPGEQLPSSLRRGIGRSKVLLLVGTEGAIDAPYVDLEVRSALERTTVIPIDVDGIRERVRWQPLAELPWINEVSGRNRTEGPSATVLESISGYARFTRRNTLMRRIVGAAAVAFLAVALVALWQRQVAVEQERLAIFQRDIALSRQLAGQALDLLESSPDLALLLAAEAGRRSVTFEARHALLGALQRYDAVELVLHDAGPVRALAFAPDGALLASSSSNAEVVLWNLGSGQRRAVLPVPDGRSASTLRFESEGRSLVAGNAGGTIAAWDMTVDPPTIISRGLALDGSDGDPAAAALISVLEARGQVVRSAAVDRVTGTLATTDTERVWLWDAAGNSLGPPLDAREPGVRALAFGPDRVLASGSSAGTIALWRIGRIGTPAISRRLMGPEVSTNSLAFSPDSQSLAAGDYDGDIFVWNLLPREASDPVVLHHGSNVRSLTFDDTNDVLASYGAPDLILWDLPSAEPIRRLAMDVRLGSAAAIDPTLAMIALGGNFGDLVLRETTTGESLPLAGAAHTSVIRDLAFSPGRGVLASAGDDRDIVLWSMDTKESIGRLEGHTGPVVDIDFAVDGNRLASYGSNGSLIVWDMETQEPVGRPLQRADAYSASSAMAISADGATAATSGPDGAITLWDVQTWRAIGQPLAGHDAAVNVLVFSPDGDQLASGGLGGTTLLWDLRIENWTALACRKANRGLTPEEAALYLIAEDGSRACESVTAR